MHRSLVVDAFVDCLCDLLSLDDGVAHVGDNLIGDLFPVPATLSMEPSRAGQGVLNPQGVALGIAHRVDVLPSGRVPPMAKDVDAACLGRGLQCSVLGNPLPQFELIDWPVQAVLQVDLIGLESLTGLVHCAAPAGEVRLAAIHQHQTQRQTKVDADDLQHQLDVTEKLGVRDVRRKALQLLAFAADDFHSRPDVFDVAGARSCRFGFRQAVAAGRR